MSDPTPDLDPTHELPEPAEERLAREIRKAQLQKDQENLIPGVLEDTERAATKDPLTELDNRRAFDEKMAAIRFAPEDQQDLREGDVRHVTILALDIDHFKRLNDTYGHGAGDEALKAVARHLQNTLPHRAQDIVARYGGEEFVVAYIGAMEDEIIEKKLIRNEHDGAAVYQLPKIPPIKLVVNGQEQEVSITVSGGITTWTSKDPLPLVLEHADKALYESKIAGRDRVTSFRNMPPDHRQHSAPERPPEPPGDA